MKKPTKQTLSEKARELGITRQAVWLKTPKGKAYRQTPKYKAYRQTPKYKAYQRAYLQTPKWKAYQRAWQKAYRQKIMAVYRKYKDGDK